jgi:hypothetical protein
LMQLKDRANQINDDVLAIFDLNLVPYKKLYSVLIQVLDFMTGQAKVQLMQLLEAICEQYA